MLNKEQVIKVMKESGLPLEEVSFGFGGALVMHGIREYTHDIDVQCTKEYFDKLLEQGYEISFVFEGTRVIAYNEYIDLHDEEPNLDRTQCIDGLLCDTVEEIIRRKTKMGREKDMIDIAIIKKHMKGGN